MKKRKASAPDGDRPAREPDKDYQVGYCRPPKHTQFAPGQCGYPTGRPRGRKNLKTIVRQFAQGRINVSEGGRNRTMSRIEALQLKLWTQAFKGDLKATAVLLQTMRGLGLLDAEPDPLPQTLSEDDEAIVRDFLKQHGDVVPENDTPKTKTRKNIRKAKGSQS